ncbi:hypothetical protein [Leptospira santarosai]|uniref:hypothetical protein n=1 Tax=Leptospira santarosai TaxID=28183 RepID=UPI001E50566D|nr:hypothetical protein [Leptospira santarosai]
MRLPYYESLEDTQGLANVQQRQEEILRGFQIGQSFYRSLYVVKDLSLFKAGE